MKKLIVLFLISISYIFASPHFVIIIPAYNASSFYEKTIESINKQTYKNYHTIYIDDGSEDNLSQKVEKYLKDNKLEKNISLKKYNNRKGSIERLFEVLYRLNDDDIILFMEGNCYFPHENTLEKIALSFEKKGSWVVYGQYKNVVNNKLSKCKKAYPKNLFSTSMRGKYWHPSKIKCFYSALLKKVKLTDIFFKNKLYDETFDSAFMFPIIEMAKDHIDFIDDVLCYFEEDLIDYSRPCQINPIKANRKILLTQPYKPIEKLFIDEKKDKADLLIFSYNRPLQLYSLLESTEKYISNLNCIHVLYRASDEKYASYYDDVKKKFSNLYNFEISIL